MVSEGAAPNLQGGHFILNSIRWQLLNRGDRGNREGVTAGAATSIYGDCAQAILKISYKTNYPPGQGYSQMR